MKRLLFLVFIFCVPIFINCSFENRIINGEETPLGKFMFLPKYYFSYSYTRPEDGAPHTYSSVGCSSTIISKRHILTAAHCVKRFTNPFNDKILEESMAYPFFVDVRPIEKDILNGSRYIDITKLGITSEVYVHREYKSTFIIKDDIAIIEFPKGADFNITPVTLAKDFINDDFNETVIAAGYGYYIFNPQYQNVSHDFPPTLRHVNVKIRPLIDNLGSIKDIYFKTESDFKDAEKWLICAGNGGELPQHTEQGDSGGPLLYELNGKTFQLGVLAFGSRNIRAPTCYQRISYYCDWIEKHTDGEAKCEEIYEEVPVTKSLPNENSPINAELKSGTPTFVTNFGYFWIASFLKFIYVSLFL